MRHYLKAPCTRIYTDPKPSQEARLALQPPPSVMSDTVEITISAETSVQEVLLALLTDLPFDGFEQREQSVHAFLQAAKWEARSRYKLIQVLRSLHLDESFEESMIQEQNWNRRWEESIRPVHVGRFCVRPTWSREDELARGRIELLIDPKMSFGTGFHESTRLMLVQLPEFVTQGSFVLDAGTGTGILAIAAAKLGANRVLGFDTDRRSYDNAVENSCLNGVSDRVEIRLGSVGDISERSFSVILANINSNALLELLPELAGRLSRDGVLLMSGLLRKDRCSMLDAISENGFEAVREEYEGDWWSVASIRVMGS